MQRKPLFGHEQFPIFFTGSFNDVSRDALNRSREALDPFGLNTTNESSEPDPDYQVNV